MKKIISDFISILITIPMSLLIGFLTMFGSFMIVVLSLIFPKKSPQITDFIVGLWAKLLLFTARTDLTIKGIENVPLKEGCLFTFNHLSNYDIPVLWDAIPRSFRFGAKIELFKIPFFGRAMELAGTLKIDRSNRKEAIATLNQAKHRFAAGECFALAAEGTRQFEPRIGEFKSGPFIFAIQAQAPIVPVVLYGTDKIQPKKQLFLNFDVKKNVTVQFLPPVKTEGYGLDDRESLKKIIRDQFVSSYEALKKADPHNY